MSLILNLETATTNCSVSLARDGTVIALKELNAERFSHAEKLHVFIKEIVKESNTLLSSIDAIAVSKGPGSYTGLRIGVSAAKGLCFALDKPLIAVSTLKSMATQLGVVDNGAVLIPVLDARRMEVYAAVFDGDLKRLRDTRAEVIDEQSFKEFLGAKEVHFLGSGAKKIQDFLGHDGIFYHCDIVPSAKEMAPLSYKKFEDDDFEDVAYFEPYYLKDFMVQMKQK